METSYFSKGARCLPGEKLANLASDAFEYGWDVPCGVTPGDVAYPIRFIRCD
jgi:hypothetical protein